MSDDAPAQKKEEGSPAWVMTFADLMSLLMCFFVLLLSFSEMDVSKYKEMAGSMKNAFGVQREVQVKEPPKGINVIAREFSPGRPEPTIMNVIRQNTTMDVNINLDLGKLRRRPVPTPKAENDPDKEKTMKPEQSASKQADRQIDQKAGQQADLKAGEQSGKQAQLMPGKQRSQTENLTEAQKQELEKAKALAKKRLDEKLIAESQLAMMQNQQKRSKDGVKIDQKSMSELLKAKLAAEKRKKMERSAKLISNALGKEIKGGSVDVETSGQKIIIRVREKASFGSGRAELKNAFRPLLAKVTKILKGSEGKIIVAGHTDNIPIYTERFRSNWELSSARAVSVAHEMMLATDIPSDRFLIQGFADTQPMVKNDSVANRAKNRRVEIVLLQGDDLESKDKGISVEKPVESKPRQRQTVPDRKSAPKKPAASSGPVSEPARKPVAGIRIGGAKATAESKPVAPKVTPKPASGSGIKAVGGR